MQGKRRRLAEIGLALFGLIAGLLALELLVRLAAPAPLKRNGYPVVRGGASFRPENAAGYRDVDHVKKKPAGVHRAVFIGDSFTYGAGVLYDDTYAKRIERGLTADRGEPWEAVILARPGIATAEEARIAREEAFEYEPDLLLLGYCLNDAEISGAAEQKRAEEWRKPGLLETPFFQRSALLTLVAGRLRATRENKARIANYLDLYRDDQPGYKAVIAGMSETATLAHERKVPFVLVLFPLFGNPLDRTYPFESVHKKLEGAFRPMGLIFIDLLPFYRGLDWKLLVVEGGSDEHPNEVAHRIAAEAVLRSIDGPRNHAAPNEQ